MNHKHLFAVSLIALVSSCADLQSPTYDHYQDISDTSLRQVKNYSLTTQDFFLLNGEAKTLAATQNTIKKELKDPDSAKFQDLRVVDYLGGKVVCGAVNAKNSYGGYVGFKRFVASDTGYCYLEDDPKYPQLNEASNTGLYAACGR